jgi:RNA polymerase sigma-70 factor (ECF subfamily)
MPSKHHRAQLSKEELEQLKDARVVEECQNGSREAFDVLFRRYRGKVYAIAYSITKNRDEALDIVQEAFTKVFRHLGSFKGDSSFYTWLYRITMNLCIDLRRRSIKTQSVEYVDGQRDVKDENAPVDSPSENLDRKELMDRLMSTIEQLPYYHRQVILMREIGGMSYEEIAKATKVSKGTVMSRLFHARRKIRDKMERYLKDTP